MKQVGRKTKSETDLASRSTHGTFWHVSKTTRTTTLLRFREKDGVWACLAWLSVMAHTGLGVQELLEAHWKSYGRNFFTRYDYEGCESQPSDDMMAALEQKATSPGFVGQQFSSGGKTYVVKEADNFAYTDPVDGSVAKGQVCRYWDASDYARHPFTHLPNFVADTDAKLHSHPLESACWTVISGTYTRSSVCDVG